MHHAGTVIGNGENWRGDSAGWGRKEIGKWGEWGMSGTTSGEGREIPTVHFCTLRWRRGWMGWWMGWKDWGVEGKWGDGISCEIPEVLFFWHYMHQQSSMTQWDTMCSYLMMLSVQIDKQSMAFEALTAVRMVIVSHGVIGWWTHFHAESHLWTSKFCLIIDSTQGSISRWSLWGTALTLCLLLLSIPCTV